LASIGELADQQPQSAGQKRSEKIDIGATESSSRSDHGVYSSLRTSHRNSQVVVSIARCMSPAIDLSSFRPSWAAVPAPRATTDESGFSLLPRVRAVLLGSADGETSGEGNVRDLRDELHDSTRRNQ
jgi:hypothetical protein